MIKHGFLILAFLFIPSITVGEVITENHWDSLNWGYSNKTNGATSTECAATGDPIGYAESITCSSDPYCSSTPDPAKVLRITFKGTTGHALRSGQYPATVSYDVNTGPVLWVSYWFKYSSNYQWEPSQNKHFYFKNFISGATPDSNNLLIFGIRGGRRKPAVSIAGGVGNWEQNVGSTELNLVAGRWYKFKGYFHMNTGANDGGWKIWIDDVLLINNPTGMPLRRSSQFGGQDIVKVFDFEPTWGGAMAGCVNQDMYLYYDNLILSTAPIGSSDSKLMPIPSPPEYLSIQE